MSRIKTSVSMRDIAKELGVSTVAVSRALGGKEGVGGDLAERVRRQAEKMGYAYSGPIPPADRRAAVGILIGEKYLGESSYYWLFFMELLRALKKQRYLGALEIVTGEEESSLILPAFVQANRIGGLILLGQLSDDYLTMIRKREPHTIFLDFYSDLLGGDCIVSNNFLASYSLTKLLIEKGHKKIAFIGSPSATTSILDRYMGFCKAMIEAGLPYSEGIPDRDSQGYGYEVIELDVEKFTAYVCNNDQLAGTVIRQLRRNGIKVPKDVSIVGFDNAKSAITGGIGVTSVEASIDAMCEAAAAIVTAYIENQSYQSQGKMFIEARIIEKESVASPKL